MKRTPLDAVADATDALAKLREATEAAERDWKAAIRRAMNAGVSPTEVAEAAGVSRPRVYQIRDDR